MTETLNYRGQGRVAFLAHKDEFLKLLTAGYPLKLIYDNHKEQLGIGYPQFTKYVSRYLRKANNDEHQRKDYKQNQTTTITPSKSDSSAVFKHSANSGNERDDLI